jgi:hypothetical protein
MAIDKLKSAAALEISPVYHDGALAEVRVRVKNIRAGHNLPTSLTNVREVWLEVTVKDAAGRPVITSGLLDEHGSVEAGTRMFNSDGMGADFHFAIDPWVVTGFTRHDTIPPRGYKDTYFGVGPVKKKGPVTVEARLRYRQADQKVAKKLLQAVPADIELEKTYGITASVTVPVVDMATATASFNSRDK